MSNDPKTKKGPSGKLLLVLALIAVVIGLILTMQNREKAPEPVAQKNEAPKPQAAAPETQGNRPGPTMTPPPEESAPEPAENAQRAYLIEDFRDTKRDWSKFKMNHVKLSSEGISLEDGQTEGSFESPCTALKLPSNMVALLWKQTLPDGTVVKPEMSLSSDCQTWSAWYPIESTGDDINPLYPDGSPNPNYGYVPGSYVSLGLSMVPFVRYRFNLVRADLSKPSPIVPIARFYHLDSTLGQGAMAKDSDFPPGPPSPEEIQANAAASKNLQEIPTDTTVPEAPEAPKATP
jgi:hypothetical protein